MTPSIRRLMLTLAAAPLVLGVAACNKSADAASNPADVKPVPAPAGKAWSDVVSKLADGGMLMGNPTAPVKLVEYGSLSCPHCAKWSQEGAATLIGKYVASGEVSYEYHSFAIHPQDVPLTVLVRCVPQQAFFPILEQLYANFDAMGERAQKGIKEAQAALQGPAKDRFTGMSDAMGYTDFFTARGLSKAAAHQCLTNTAAASAVANEADAIGKKGIDSTPTVFVNGVKVGGATWVEADAALKTAGVK